MYTTLSGMTGYTYGDVHHKGEVEWSFYNFEYADVGMLRKFFDMCEAESIRMSEKELILPTYDYCLKCSTFQPAERTWRHKCGGTYELHRQGEKSGQDKRRRLSQAKRKDGVSPPKEK